MRWSRAILAAVVGGLAAAAPVAAAPPAPSAAMTDLAPPLGCVGALGASCGLSGVGSSGLPVDLAMAPDGRSVYAVVRTSDHGGRLLAFARDSASGRLQPLEGPGACFARAATACGPARGLRAPTDVDVSPDGRQVYVLSENPSDERPHGSDRGGEAVLTFRRDAVTGRLSRPRGTEGCRAADGRYGCTAAWNVFGAETMTLAPDGHSLYLMSDAFGIAVLRRDGRTGRLSTPPTPQACIEDFLRPQCASAGRITEQMSFSGVVVSRDGRRLFLHGETIVAMARDPRTGDVRALPGSCLDNSEQEYCRRVRAIEAPELLVAAPDGRRLYASDTSALSVVRVGSRGTFTQAPGRSACLHASARSCIVSRSLDYADVRMLLGTPDGRRLYAIARDRVIAVRIDRRTGALRTSRDQLAACVADAVSACAPAHPLGDIGAAVLSPDARHLYVADRTGPAVTVLAADRVTGALRAGDEGSCVPLLPTQSCGGWQPELGLPLDLALSADERELHVLTGQRVLTLGRDPATGGLRPGLCPGTGCVSLSRSRSSEARLAESPDGRNVYVGGDELEVLGRDEATGALRRLPGQAGCVASFEDPPCLTRTDLGITTETPVVAPDGRDVYTGASALQQLRRNAADGSLSLPADGPGCFRLTGDAEAVVPEPPSQGPTCAPVRVDGYIGALAVSPDGRTVYAVTGSAIVTFRRDVESGALRPPDGPTWCISESVTDGCALGPPLGEPAAAHVSDDGKVLYVSTDANAVVALLRDPDSGALSAAGDPSCMGPLDSGCLTVRGFAGVRAFGVSADGRALAGAGGVVWPRRGLASGSQGGTACLLGWPAPTCRVAWESDDDPGPAVLTRDGRHAYTADDGVIRAWALRPPAG